MKRALLVFGMLLGMVGLMQNRLLFANVLTIQDLNAVRAYPNPWKISEHATIPIIFDQIPTNGATTLRIFTISGELVRTLSGSQSVQWDIRNQRGQFVASGVYLYLLTADNQQKTGKVVVIR